VSLFLFFLSHPSPFTAGLKSLSLSQPSSPWQGRPMVSPPFLQLRKVPYLSHLFFFPTQRLYILFFLQVYFLFLRIFFSLASSHFTFVSSFPSSYPRSLISPLTISPSFSTSTGLCPWRRHFPPFSSSITPFPPCWRLQLLLPSMEAVVPTRMSFSLRMFHGG